MSSTASGRQGRRGRGRERLESLFRLSQLSSTGGVDEGRTRHEREGKSGTVLAAGPGLRQLCSLPVGSAATHTNSFQERCGQERKEISRKGRRGRSSRSNGLLSQIPTRVVALSRQLLCKSLLPSSSHPRPALTSTAGQEELSSSSS